MVVLEQYPHYLYYRILTPSTQNADGTWSKSTASWVYLCKCRIERNQAQSITTADGKIFQFTATIYMPRNSALKPLEIGTRIFVASDIYDEYDITEEDIEQGKKNGIILIDKPNATFEIGRLHNRMWV